MNISKAITILNIELLVHVTNIKIEMNRTEFIRIQNYNFLKSVHGIKILLNKYLEHQLSCQFFCKMILI